MYTLDAVESTATFIMSSTKPETLEEKGKQIYISRRNAIK
jgi:hypothetical protein